MDLVAGTHVDNVYQHMNDDSSHLTAHFREGEVINPFSFNSPSGIDSLELQNNLSTSRSFHNEYILEGQRYFSREYLGNSGTDGINTSYPDGHANWNAGTIAQSHLPNIDIAIVDNASAVLDLSKPNIEAFQYQNHSLNLCMWEAWSLGQSTKAYDTSVTPNLPPVAASIVPDAGSVPAHNRSNPVLSSSRANHSVTHLLTEGGLKGVNEASGNTEKGKEVNRRRKQTEVCDWDDDITTNGHVSVSPKRAKITSGKASQSDSTRSVEEPQIRRCTPLVHNFIPAAIPAHYRVEFAAVETVCTPTHLLPERSKRRYTPLVGNFIPAPIPAHYRVEFAVVETVCTPTHLRPQRPKRASHWRG
ncbi:hypothetical protein BDZ91DRAFT_797809 [Kalaharituber pfeilii]|nr:hypothetical protein BDZ91DRAFT_797809 [Kalaharituber pfeilii]